LARGKSASIKVDMSAISAFSGEVTLSCSNLPAGVSCATAKAQVKADGSLVSTTLTITANPVQQSSNGQGGSGALLAFSLPGLGLVGVVFTDASRRRKLLFTSLAILVVLASLAGCGGAAQAPPASINNGNIAASMQAAVVGTYDITVVATAGMTQQSTTATIAVE
jgi:hypothetical protein